MKATALVCYLVALAGAAALAALVLALGLGLPLPPRPVLSLPAALACNLGWLIVFGLQHSGMARCAWKERWTRLVPPALERSIYAGVSGVLLLGLALTWQDAPAGPALWSGPRWLVVVPLLAGLGMAVVNRDDHLGLFGLRQAWGLPEDDRLRITGAYRFVRHPLMLGLLVFLWAQPAMPPALVLLSGGLSAYILVGTWLEERDLLRRFPTAYAGYRQRVPALVPWRWPAPSSVHPEEVHP